MVDVKRIKKKTQKTLISIGILVAIFVVLILVRLLSPEDAWICQNGKWVRHGNPAAEMPQRPCR